MEIPSTRTTEAAPWLRRLVVSSSPWRARLDPWPVHMRFEVEVAMEKALLKVFPFYLDSTILPMLHTNHTYTYQLLYQLLNVHTEVDTTGIIRVLSATCHRIVTRHKYNYYYYCYYERVIVVFVRG